MEDKHTYELIATNGGDQCRPHGNHRINRQIPKEPFIPINFTGHRLEKNFEGVPLEISYSGKVKRAAFKIRRRGGWCVRNGKEFWKKSYIQRWEEKILASRVASGYETVMLRDKDGKQWCFGVQVLMAISWEVEGYENWLKDPKEYTVDHIDRDKQNNSIENLRFATKSQQKHNSWIQRNNETGYRGVCVDPRPALGCTVYRYQIQINKIRYANHDNGGPKHYETAEEAARERDLRIIELEEEGKIGVDDTPLNFPEVRFEASIERWPVAM